MDWKSKINEQVEKAKAFYKEQQRQAEINKEKKYEKEMADSLRESQRLKSRLALQQQRKELAELKSKESQYKKAEFESKYGGIINLFKPKSLKPRFKKKSRSKIYIDREGYVIRAKQPKRKKKEFNFFAPTKI